MENTDASVPAEHNEDDYIREVLQLEKDQTEALLDDGIAQEAEKLGIKISRPPTPEHDQNMAHNSMCESAMTLASHHARTASTGSNGSASTGMTSRSSNEQLDSSSLPAATKRSNSRRSLSFSEYEKYLVQHEAQDFTKLGLLPPPMPSEPAPSLFSVSTRKSYLSIKNGFKNKFKLRRTKSSQEHLR